ncbi:ribonucleotide reductase of class Ib (aerobic), beta subunit [Staphylococcus gallinarum]|uniref:Ribonucleotide reductase of class Ib (Aerobic), beta subunit n=1 Tax=Staphylococcus gallinarum TaxID=1293 RepID=A0A380FEF4_STAGA|nr:ribonucleotide reductase of class Ib (aerobic), beta subunit [Staphylococcus gallinarum]
MKAVNWNTQEDMTNMFWRQNISQMWVETEFKVSKDIASLEDVNRCRKKCF